VSNGYSNGKLPASALAPIAQGSLAIECAAGWNALNVEARANGLELVPTGSKSSYRSYEQQVELYNAYLNGTGNLAAKPGTSNHGWGTAVDLATPDMRSMVDRIGAKYGWSKSWSDAPSEWWHVCYQAGHYSGPDPGPSGQAVQPPTEETVVAIAAVVKQDGRIEVFVQTEGKSNDTVWHTWQVAVNGGWAGSDKGKVTTWQNMGKLGK
jgi:hypothetical protein